MSGPALRRPRHLSARRRRATTEESETPSARDGRVETQDLGSRDGSTWRFRHLNLEVPGGSLVAVLDEHGWSRVPLLLTLAGRLRPTEGTALVGGVDVRRHPAAVRLMVGLGEIHNVNDMDRGLRVIDLMRERLALARGQARHLAPEALLARAGLDVGLSSPVEELTVAQRLLFGAALALAEDPPVLAVDGVDCALSRSESVAVWRALRAIAQRGTTVLAGCLEPGPADAVDMVLRT